MRARYAYELARAIAHAGWWLRRAVGRHVAHGDSEWRLLGIVAESDRLGRKGERPTQAELSAMLGLSPSAFTRLVDRAVGRGLVRRVRGASRRAWAVELTSKGRAAWERVRRQVSEILPEFFSGVEEREAEVALRVLQRVSFNIRSQREVT